jgi:histidinol dehydrogenase
MDILYYGKDNLDSVLQRQGVDYNSAFGVVRPIVEAVWSKGDRALIEYTREFDKVELDSLKVGKTEVDAALKRLDPKVVKSIERAHANIQSLHTVQYKSVAGDWMYMVEDGVVVGERFTALESVGCYVPGGRAAYPSTVLMTVTPAKIVGVKRVVVVSPPPISDAVLAACRITGVDEVYSVGGAQAIAALAYGTDSIRAVDKIVGPGNNYVTAAKMLVYGLVDVDMPAGPSEVMIIADSLADPWFIASDVLAQAEHDPNAQCVLVTDSVNLAKEVWEAVEGQKKNSEKIEIISKSLQNFKIIKTYSICEAVEFANQYAPEHLEIHTKNAEEDAAGIRNAGAVFIGPYSPVAAGDYASGGNHVLPTGGAARYSSQLSVRDFIKSTSIQNITKKGLEGISETVTTLAELEGLTEHKKSIEKRFKY